MFDIGFLELLLIAVISLLVLGPERLPGAARRAGLWVGKARRVMADINRQVDDVIRQEELKESIARETRKIGLSEAEDSVRKALDEARQFEHLTDRLETEPPPQADKKAHERPTSD